MTRLQTNGTAATKTVITPETKRSQKWNFPTRKVLRHEKVRLHRWSDLKSCLGTDHHVVSIHVRSADDLFNLRLAEVNLYAR